MFEVKILRIKDIRPIPDADKICTYIIGNDWPVVDQVNKYQIGSLVAYLPIDSLIPDNLLEQLELTGKLSGARKNKVKAIRLRKQLSLGIICPAPEGFTEGDDVQSYYGIERFEEVIPEQFRGIIRPKPPGYIKFDVDNIRNESWFEANEEVVCTEKIHGTSSSYVLIEDRFYVCSRNICLEQDDNNLYWKITKKYNIEEKLRSLGMDNVWIHGEIFGKGVQDLIYNCNEPEFRIFDARLHNNYYNYDHFLKLMCQLELPTVPELYRGPFSQEIVDQYTSGMEQVSGTECHIREGIVIRPVTERIAGKNTVRVISKSVSEAYLLRKNGTEFH